ncbi:MAG: DUF2203 domain-containing protein [Planctomycetota bacterium]|nr:DUF2203 domain-containing protein [Planctomycetota bacterium]
MAMDMPDRDNDGVLVQTVGRRRFTLGEANKALVLVKKIIADVVADYRRLLDLHEMIESGAAAGALDRTEAARDELVDVAERLRNCLQELEDIGVDLIDWAKGVVAFPCLVDGRDVCLCWEYGQTSVSYWHDVTEGVEGRKPIATFPAAATARV